jgi:hypothetical protein
VACFATYYLSTSFALGYGVTTLGYSREAFLAIQLGAILFMAIGIVIAGYWSDATTPRGVLMWGCGMVIVAGLLLAPMLGSGSLLLVFGFLSLSLFCMGFVYGRWAPSCRACSRRASATPAPRWPSMSAAFWAAASPPWSPSSWPTAAAWSPWASISAPQPWSAS